ncbi:hypothetical protein Lal_00026162 [Lupinus albus]|nr:hypothetical protein Lal_00026162 [Lupinus albus]
MPGVGGISVGNGSKEYPGNLTPFVTITCIVAAMGGLIFGYDIGISGIYYIHIITNTNLVLTLWSDVNGSVFEEVFSVGVSEEKGGRIDEQVLSIRQRNTDDIYIVAIPGGAVVVGGGVYGDA